MTLYIKRAIVTLPTIKYYFTLSLSLISLLPLSHLHLTESLTYAFIWRASSGTNKHVTSTIGNGEADPASFKLHHWVFIRACGCFDIMATVYCWWSLVVGGVCGGWVLKGGGCLSGVLFWVLNGENVINWFWEKGFWVWGKINKIINII